MSNGNGGYGHGLEQPTLNRRERAFRYALYRLTEDGTFRIRQPGELGEQLPGQLGLGLEAVPGLGELNYIGAHHPFGDPTFTPTYRGAVPSSIGSLATVLGDVVHGMLNALGLAEEAPEPEPALPPDYPVIDPTDPRYQLPEDAELPPSIMRLRMMRRLARGLNIVNPFEPESGASVAGSIASGYMAPPASAAESAMDFLAETIPGLIGGGAGYWGVRQLAMAGIKRAGVAGAQRAGATWVGRMAERAAVKGTQMGGATAGSQLAGEAAARAAVPEYLADLAGEIVAGAGIGAAEMWRLQDSRTQTDKKMIGYGAMFGAAGGAILGSAFNIPITTSRMIRNAKAMEALISAGVLPESALRPQLQIGPKRIFKIHENGTPEWRWTESGVDYVNAKGEAKVSRQGALAPAPTREEASAFGTRLLETFQANREEAERLLGKEAVERALENPGTAEYRAIQAMESQYMPTAVSRSKYYAGMPEAIEQEAMHWEIIAMDAKDDMIRWGAMARARALRRAAGQAVEPFPGNVPIEVEEALQYQVKMFPKSRLETEAARLESAGHKPRADRLRELIDDGIPEAPRGDLNAAINRVQAASGRGITRGTELLGDDGTILVVQQQRLGYVSAKPKNATKAVANATLEAESATIIPRVGRKVRLKNGQVLEVQRVDITEGNFVGKTAKGKNVTASMGDIEFIDEAAYARNVLERQFKQQKKGVTGKKVKSPTKQRMVDERSGEPVEIEEIADEDVVVRSARTGRQRTVPQKNLKKSNRTASRQRRAAREVAEAAGVDPKTINQQKTAALMEIRRQLVAGEIEPEAARQMAQDIVSGKATLPPRSARLEGEIPFLEAGYTPGKVGQRTNKVLYFRVPHAVAQEFEAGATTGNLTAGWVRSSAQELSPPMLTAKEAADYPLSILPLPDDGGTVLYAIEVPAQYLPKKGNYHGRADEMLRVLGGKANKGDIQARQAFADPYASPVRLPDEALENAEIFRVPDELRATLKSPDELRAMSPEEFTDYMRRALILDSDLDAEVAGATAAARKSRRAAAVKAREGEHGAAMTAAERGGENIIDAAEAQRDAILAELREVRDRVARLLREREAARPAPGQYAGEGSEITFQPKKGDVTGGRIIGVIERDEAGVPIKYDVETDAGKRVTVYQDQVTSHDYVGFADRDIPGMDVARELGEIEAELRVMPGNNPGAWDAILNELPGARDANPWTRQPAELPAVQAVLGHPERPGVRMLITKRIEQQPIREVPAGMVAGETPGTVLQHPTSGRYFRTKEEVSKAIHGRTKKSRLTGEVITQEPGVIPREVYAPIKRGPDRLPVGYTDREVFHVQVIDETGNSWERRFVGSYGPQGGKVMSPAEEVRGFIQQTQFVKSRVRNYANVDYVRAVDAGSGATIVKSGGKEGQMNVRFTKLIDQGDGDMKWENVVTMPFDSGEEADLALTAMGYVRRGVEQGKPFHVIRQIRQIIPDPDNVTPGALQKAHDSLETATMQVLAERKHIPDDLKDYLYRFMDAWSGNELEGVPFNMRIRQALDAYQPEDLGPGPYWWAAEGADVSAMETGALKLGAGVDVPRGVPGAVSHSTTTRQRIAGIATGNRAWPTRVYLNKDQILDPERVADWRRFLEGERIHDFVSDAKPREIALTNPEPSAHRVAARPRFVQDGETGEFYRLLDAEPQDGNYLVERWNKETFEVSSRRVTEVNPTRAGLYWRKQVAAAFNEAPLPTASVTVEAGLGDVERQLGMHGWTNRQRLREGFGEAINGVLADVRQSKNGRFYFTKAQKQELERYYRRAMELGLELPEVPKRMKQALDAAVVQQVAADYGGHPMGALIGQAMVNRLEPSTLKRLGEWAATNGLKDLPPHVQLERLIHMGALDPQAAKVMFDLKDKLNWTKWLMGADAPRGLYSGVPTPELEPTAIINTYRKPNDISELGVWIGIPHKSARRQPTYRAGINAIYEAAEEFDRYAAEGYMLVDAFETRYPQVSDQAAIRGWIEREGMDTVDDALAAGMPQHYAQGFAALKDFFERRKYDVVWVGLKRGQQAAPLRNFVNADGKLSAEVVQTLERIKPGLSDELMADPARLDEFMLMDRVRGTHGNFTDDEIDEFIRLLKTHETVDEMIEMNPGAKQKYVEQFTFWKNYGIRNYWPYIHEGQIALEQTLADGTKKLVGFAYSPVDALDAIRWAKANGRLAPDAQVGIREMAPMYDDVLMTTIGSRRFNRIKHQIAKIGNMEPDEVSAMLAQQGALAPGTRAPWTAHFERRVAGLKPIREKDPMLDLLIYNTRLGRARYRHELQLVRENYLLDDTLDRKLSASFSTPTLREMPNLRRQFAEQLNASLGEYTNQDRWFDFVMGWYNMLRHAPAETIRRAMGADAEGIPLSKIWTYRHHTRMFAGRHAAAQVVGLQSLIRLGGSPMSAIVNLSQLATNTAPMIGERGVMRGLREALDFTFHKGSSAFRDEITELFDVCGIRYHVGKHVAGSSGLDWQTMGLSPGLKVFQRKGLREGGIDWAKYLGMYMFDRAEGVNRKVTAIGAYRHAMENLGMERSAAQQYAKQMVVDTQFLYNVQAQPLFMKGPVARIMFQFKPFLVNQISFEKDMLMTMLGRGGNRLGLTQAEATRAMARHLAWYAGLGGLRGIVNHPLLMPLTGFMALTGKKGLEEWLVAHNRIEKDRKTKGLYEGSGAGLLESEQYAVRDIVYHGLPALFGLSVGNRIGVSGQELQMDQFFQGPHVGMMWDFFNGMRGYMKSPHAGKGAIIPGAAAAVGTARYGIFGGLFAGVAAGAGGSALASANPAFAGVAEFDRVGDYFATPDGWKAVNAALPTFMRNVLRTVDILQDEGPRDLRGRPLNRPQYTNMAHEFAAAMMSAQSVDAVEARALSSILMAGGDEDRMARMVYAEQMAQAIVEGDWGTYHRVSAQAARDGYAFSYGDLQDRIERMEQPVYESVRQAQPVGGRWPNYLGLGY